MFGESGIRGTASSATIFGGSFFCPVSSRSLGPLRMRARLREGEDRWERNEEREGRGGRLGRCRGIEGRVVELSSGNFVICNRYKFSERIGDAKLFRFSASGGQN
jgi:hypothetical protein